MAKLTNPVRFSDCFNVDSDRLSRLGVLDPTLCADTRLFIDPMLLEQSSHKEFSQGARSTYIRYFERIISVVAAIKEDGDTYYRNAWRLLSFPEIKWTCLGYGARSVAGSGSGNGATGQMLKTARDIIALGIRDPDIFVAMALFEKDFGPDLISDMTTNVILPNLLEFNSRILNRLSIPTERFPLRLKNGNSYTAALPRNPYVNARTPTPVLLVPTDILRDLPVATSWEDVSAVAAENAAIRCAINNDIASLWQTKTLHDKEKLKDWALSGKTTFEAFLEMIHGASKDPYNITGDPNGEVFWHKFVKRVATENPLSLNRPPTLNVGSVTSVVQQIVDQFRFLVEKRRYSKELYDNGRPRHEKAAQRLFYAIAYSYCKANNLDITPEAETGTGPVDFKVSTGFSGRVLVEVKLSTNPKAVRGYQHQLKTYAEAEESVSAFYVVIDVGGGFSGKRKQLERLRHDAMSSRNEVPALVFIDGRLSASASRR